MKSATRGSRSALPLAALTFGSPGAHGGPESLFELLPDVYYFVKDASGRFVGCNGALAKLVGVRSPEEVLGRRDEDFFPAQLCESFAADDRAVLTTGRPIVDKLEIVRNAEGALAWHHTSKVPVFAPDGRAVAVAGITRDLGKAAATGNRFLALAPAVELILNRFEEPLTVTDLAAAVGLSVSQFERRFKQRFGTTPLRYLTQVRISAACELLGGTELPLAEIAERVGFYDQSHLTNQFAAHKGVTPARYRRALRAATHAQAPAAAQGRR